MLSHARVQNQRKKINRFFFFWLVVIFRTETLKRMFSRLCLKQGQWFSSRTLGNYSKRASVRTLDRVQLLKNWEHKGCFIVGAAGGLFLELLFYHGWKQWHPRGGTWVKLYHLNRDQFLFSKHAYHIATFFAPKALTSVFANTPSTWHQVWPTFLTTSNLHLQV